MFDRTALAVAGLLATLATAPFTASAQDAGRGASLYRQLPGQPAVGSCISCHGEPINNRNSVLRGAAGPDLISKTIAAVARMGYLRQYLTDPDLGDISAYLATIVPAGAVDTLPEPWPTADDFGTQVVGTQSSARSVLIRNLQPRTDIAIGTVRSSDPMAFPVQHDCPVSLPPLGQCTATTWFRPQAEGAAVARVAVVNISGQVLREATLSGTGVGAPPSALAWSPGTPALVDFGQVAVGQTARREFSLLNNSSGAVALASLRVTGPNASRFTLDAPCAGAARLDAGAACAVTLSFVASSPGRAEGWIEIVSDASNAPLVRVAAAGVAGVVAVAPAEPVASAPAGSSGGSGGGAMSAAWVAMLLAAVLALRRVGPT